MSADSIVEEPFIHARPDETDDIGRLLGALQTAEQRDQVPQFIDANGTRIPIPHSAFEALLRVVDGMAQGLTMTLIPYGKEITTQQAADLLGMSRPYFVKLLEAGEIPFSRVGTHRRVRIEEVLKYRKLRNANRRAQLEELVRLSEDLPGGYLT